MEIFQNLELFHYKKHWSLVGKSHFKKYERQIDKQTIDKQTTEKVVFFVISEPAYVDNTKNTPPEYVPNACNIVLLNNNVSCYVHCMLYDIMLIQSCTYFMVHKTSLLAQ